MPKRIQRKRTRGWKMPAGAKYVGRNSPFANRWRVLRMVHDDLPTYWIVQDENRTWYPSSERAAAKFAVWMYRRWLRNLSDARLRLAVAMYRGKDLACWCEIGAPCHADVLLELANTTARDAR